MIQNKIVIHYQDGRMMKGITIDFFPNKDIFHLVPADSPPGTKPLEISVPELKAIFFVKEFGGNPKYEDKKEFDPGKNFFGRKIKVVFKDGELMIGTTSGYEPNRSGFFVTPVDPISNIDRCFVVKTATKDVSLL
jgi:hypothetical protein